ncbi:hypothetical protein RA307_30010 [Xanthobacteraceae bacterium Astr-EGSB]|uniref:hypothetical protein n=1 Tax=Astrobacterium formosum TaxID=3069710 RepID=UPI0027B68430|nr:hypothetical protein [Xanthobacteraceae bacterium Astr-EGSB]
MVIVVMEFVLWLEATKYPAPPAPIDTFEPSRKRSGVLPTGDIVQQEGMRSPSRRQTWTCG